MELTLIMIVNNTAPFITNLLASLQKIKCKQLIMLNGMIDVKSIRLVENYAKSSTNIKLYKNSTLLRHPIAANFLLSQVDTKYVFIMDSDILTTEKDLLLIYDFIRKNPQYGAVQGTLVYPQSNKIQSTGHIYYEYQDHYGLYNSLFLPNNSKPLNRQALSAGFSMYHMDLLRNLNGFDEFYTLKKDGTELTTRIHYNGHKLCCLPNARGYHFHSLFRKTIEHTTFNEIGRYWATYGNFLKDDLCQEIISNVYFKDFSEYKMIDCSTIKNINNFINLLDFNENQYMLKISDLCEKKFLLHNHIPNSVLKTKNKILWICSNYEQLLDNYTLYTNLNRENDYIIDLSANVVPVSLLYK